MRFGHRRAVALLGALVASVVVLVVPAAGSPAAPAAGPCLDSRGVTVVVDFAALGGGTKVRCVPAPVSSGFEALTKAGFVPEGTQSFPGLLCRIDHKPSPEQDACVRAPSQEQYWSYWYAPRGGGWTYSSSGAGSRKPPEGSVEGWAFGDSDKPSIAPPPLPATTTTTRPPATTTTTSGSAGTAPGATSTTIAGGTTSSAPPGGVAAGDGVTTTTAAAGAVDADRSDGTTTSTDDGADELAAGDEASSVGGGSGSPVGAAAAGLAVVGLGGAAWWRSRRAGATG